MLADALLHATLFGIALVTTVAIGVWLLTRWLLRIPPSEDADQADS